MLQKEASLLLLLLVFSFLLTNYSVVSVSSVVVVAPLEGAVYVGADVCAGVVGGPTSVTIRVSADALWPVATDACPPAAAAVEA